MQLAVKTAARGGPGGLTCPARPAGVPPRSGLLVYTARHAELRGWREVGRCAATASPRQQRAVRVAASAGGDQQALLQRPVSSQ
jgi:hypothetical protein